ncbi:MAG: inorganic phosphate transporter [Candidatus Hodarchaeales archaeon]
MLEAIIFIFAVAMAFAVAFAAGTNDEMMAPGVASGVFTLRTAVILGAIFSVIGAFLMGAPVAKKIGKDLVGNQILTDPMIISILIAMIIVLVSTSIAEGLPISTTQSVIGAIIGVCTIAGLKSSEWGVFSVDYWQVVEIAAGWILSPIIGFFAAATVQFWLQRFEEAYFTRKLEEYGKLEEREDEILEYQMTDRERLDHVYTYLLAVFLVLSSASRAGNDVANSIAPVLSLQIINTNSIGSSNEYLMIIGGVGMALGLILVGWKVIKVVAKEIVSMNTGSALSAMISVTLVMTFGTLAGFPLSGTHVLIAAMIAVGWAERLPIQRKMVRMIVISWVVTVPVTAVLGAGVWFVVDWIYIALGLGI